MGDNAGNIGSSNRVDWNQASQPTSAPATPAATATPNPPATTGDRVERGGQAAATSLVSTGAPQAPMSVPKTRAVESTAAASTRAPTAAPAQASEGSNPMAEGMFSWFTKVMWLSSEKGPLGKLPLPVEIFLSILLLPFAAVAGGVGAIYGLLKSLAEVVADMFRR